MHSLQVKEIWEMVYADNAATTKLDIEAFEAMKPFLLDSFSNPSQPYSFSRVSRKAIKEARETIAKCIGADSEEIFFTSGGTESDNWAIKIASCGGYVITSAIEHHAILNSCIALERSGRTVSYLGVDNRGMVDITELEAKIDASTKLVSVMFANNEIGTIQPIVQLAEIAHKYNCLFHTDAVQAVGHVKIDVHEMGIDLLSASAHKFNGPKGIGFLFIKKGTDIFPLIDGGSQEFGYRAGTENVASIVAMAVALRNNCDYIKENANKMRFLEKRLISGLADIKLDFIRNGSDMRIPGNVNLSFKGFDGESLLHRLDLMGICISTGSACDSVNVQVSHVIRAIGVPDDYAKGTIRISLGKDNTIDDVDEILKAIRKIMQCI